MSKWNEIISDYFNEDEECVHIDGYLTGNPNEEGKTIAKIYVDGKKGTEYIDKLAETDDYAQEIIHGIIMKMEGGAYQ